MTETTVYLITHGTIAENWSSFDLLGLLQKEGNHMSQEKKGAIRNQLLEEPLLDHVSVFAIQRLMLS